MGSAPHPACPAAGSLHQARGGTAGRSCWFHAGARKAFLQKAFEWLVLADPEGCELTWRKVHPASTPEPGALCLDPRGSSLAVVSCSVQGTHTRHSALVCGDQCSSIHPWSPSSLPFLSGDLHNHSLISAQVSPKLSRPCHGALQALPGPMGQLTPSSALLSSPMCHF